MDLELSGAGSFLYSFLLLRSQTMWPRVRLKIAAHAISGLQLLRCSQLCCLPESNRSAIADHLAASIPYIVKRHVIHEE